MFFLFYLVIWKFSIVKVEIWRRNVCFFLYFCLLGLIIIGKSIFWLLKVIYYKCGILINDCKNNFKSFEINNKISWIVFNWF